MIRYWEKLVSLPEERILKAAYQESLRDRRKGSWASQVKHILESFGEARLLEGGKV